MTPKKEAEKLIDKFGDCLWSDDDSHFAAKKCATLFVDTLLTHENITRLPRKQREYWLAVKEAIKNYKGGNQ